MLIRKLKHKTKVNAKLKNKSKKSPTAHSQTVIGKKYMNRNYIPESKYRRIMKEEPNFSSLTAEIEIIEAKWASVKPLSDLKELRLYNNSRSAVAVFITTNQPCYKKTIDYIPETKIHSSESIQIREKGYYKFFDITIQIEPNDRDCISISTSDDKVNMLRKLNEEFNQIENLEFDMANLRTEEIIVNICHDIAREIKLEPCNIQIQKLLSHFVDSKPIHIYNAVIKLFSQIVDLPMETIKSKLESKLTSYKFLYSEMNPHIIEFLKSDGTQDHDGMRMVWYNKEINPIAKNVLTIMSNSKRARELEEILCLTQESTIATMCSPIYRDAIVFKTSNNKILGFLNICFECNKIESHNRTEMPVTKELINKLQGIVNPLGNK